MSMHASKHAPHRARSVLKAVGIALIIVLVAGCFLIGISNVRGGAETEGRDRLEESIRRTAAACYAAEGIYPPSIEYMEEKYGLQVDEDRYYVDYILFADNLMPDFTVLERVEPTSGHAPEATGSGADASTSASASAEAAGSANGAAGAAQGQGGS